MADRATLPLPRRIKRAWLALSGRSYDVANVKPSNGKLHSLTFRRTAEQIAQRQGGKITDVGRYLYQNIPAAKRSVRHIAARVVGKSGIVPQFADDDLDVAWKNWAARCSVRGHSWRALQVAAVADLVTVGNSYTFRVMSGGKLMLDQFEHESLTSLAQVGAGNSISGGVEFNDDGVPVAYHIQRERPGKTGMTTFNAVRIDASRVAHAWRLERPEQFRGISDLATGGIGLFDMADAILATSNGLRIEGWAGLHYKPGETATGDPAIDVGAESIPTAERSDEPGSPVKEVAFSHGEAFEYDGEVKLLSSDRPNGNFLPFVAKLEEHWAVSVGIPPHVVSGDYSKANYSSLRAAENSCKPTYEDFQQIVIEMHCAPNVRAFVEWALLSGAVAASGRTVESIMAGIEWQVPAFPYVDPLKEIEADRERLDIGAATWDQLMAERGLDGRAQRRAIKRQETLDAQFEVKTPGVGTAAKKSAPAQGQQKADADGEEIKQPIEEVGT